MWDDAHDLGPSAFSSQKDMLSYRILLRKILLCEDVIHDNNMRGVVIILRREKSSSFQRHAHDFQIVFFHYVAERPAQIIISGGFRFSLDPKSIFIVAGQRHRGPGK